MGGKKSYRNTKSVIKFPSNANWNVKNFLLDPLFPMTRIADSLVRRQLRETRRNARDSLWEERGYKKQSYGGEEEVYIYARTRRTLFKNERERDSALLML